MTRTYQMFQLRSAQQGDKSEMDISSLVDVSFLLLIFFLVTATILPREQDLKMSIPSVAQGAPVARQAMIIQLDESGTLTLNPASAPEVITKDSTSREIPELVDRLKIFAALSPADPAVVTLKVSDKVPQQQYIDVLNALAEAGVQNVTLAE
ncbi:ExbD/TolR family protein [Persicirhabdus sediminis]|uniref:Biopolymer transporter ExbD n=1 Tax=Persicirhabdus sediminis TaxID=454144 RepID=A0A8J7MGT5_9BACT|nr:biopolymer transporter ExbD [Persicirhabdus sediminis]MBK1792607.1 biopolymer transporter ExbD [Persicirhabdus sediminis]